MGPRQDRFYFHFPGARVSTSVKVKDSWAPAHSQGRSRGLDSFLPVPTSPGRSVCRGLCAVPRCLLSVSFWRAYDSVGVGGGGLALVPLQDREACSRCKLRFELRAASTSKANPGGETGLRSAWLQWLHQRLSSDTRNSHLREPWHNSYQPR